MAAAGFEPCGCSRAQQRALLREAERAARDRALVVLMLFGGPIAETIAPVTTT